MLALDFFQRKKLGHLREKPQSLRKQRKKKKKTARFGKSKKLDVVILLV